LRARQGLPLHEAFRIASLVSGIVPAAVRITAAQPASSQSSSLTLTCASRAGGSPR